MRIARPVLDVVVTVAIALLLLGALFSWSSGSASSGFPEAVRVLFNFMDVGLGLWVVLLVIFTVRAARRSRPSVSGVRTYLLLAIGAVVNLLVVITVGVIQTGGWAGDLILFAVEAGIACLVAGAIVIAAVHRATARRAAA